MTQYEINFAIHGPLATKMVRKYLQLHGAAAPDPLVDQLSHTVVDTLVDLHCTINSTPIVLTASYVVLRYLATAPAPLTLSPAQKAEVNDLIA